jgi:hypothetical protein
LLDFRRSLQVAGGLLGAEEIQARDDGDNCEFGLVFSG